MRERASSDVSVSPSYSKKVPTPRCIVLNDGDSEDNNKETGT